MLLQWQWRTNVLHLPCFRNAEVDKVSIAQEFLNTGKRNLACDDYGQAVEALAEACQLLAEKYGEQGIEVADAYFYYGKSLLGLSRVENGVLGNALDGGELAYYNSL